MEEAMAGKKTKMRTKIGEGPPQELVQKLQVERMRNEMLKRLRTKNALVGSSIMLVMAGIYIYTLKVTKQEKFLDKDFDTPGVQSSNQPAKN